MSGNDATDGGPTVEEFRATARVWLGEHLAERTVDDATGRWGVGSDSVAIFHHLSIDEARDLDPAAKQWQPTQASPRPRWDLQP